MKKDKAKHQTFTEQITTAESRISSAALTLQLLNKEKEKNKEVEKKESASEIAKIRCKTCFKEVAPKRLCSGHGGGGGGGDSATSGKTSEEKASPIKDESLTQSHNLVETTDAMIAESVSEERDSASRFDPEVIAEIIAKGLLLVDSDRESMTITIKLLCEPNALTKEQREELKKFMEAIIKEFNEFKEDNHLAGDGIKITQDRKGNILSLRMTLPTFALYDAFIQRLANNLVPTPSPKAYVKNEITRDDIHSPKPLSMEPKPSNKDNPFKREENEPKKADEEEHELFNPSPFNMLLR